MGRVQQLPRSTYTGDIHCVTTWSKFDVAFGGVCVDDLLTAAGPQAEAGFVMAHSSTGYTTNLPLADVTGGKAWIVWEYGGQAADPRARRPGAAAGPAPVLLEVRQMDQPARADGRGPAGVLGAQRLPRPRRPLARAALPGRPVTTDDFATCRATAWTTGRIISKELPTPNMVRLRMHVEDRQRHWPGQHYLIRLRAPDDYTAQRSYSLASDDSDPLVEFLVERLPDGEVSEFLADVAEVGDVLELRGPIGRWFRWDTRHPGALPGRRYRRRPGGGHDAGGPARRPPGPAPGGRGRSQPRRAALR